MNNFGFSEAQKFRNQNFTLLFNRFDKIFIAEVQKHDFSVINQAKNNVNLLSFTS